MLPLHQTRSVVYALKLLVIVVLVGAGALVIPDEFGSLLPKHSPVVASLYWLGCAMLALYFVTGKYIWSLAARWRFQVRFRAAVPAKGQDLNRLAAVAAAIRQNHEERAFFLLENLKLRSGEAETLNAQRWLAALAGVRWMARQKPVVPISPFYQRFSQIHALVFCFEAGRAGLRRQVLSRELQAASSADLDALAQSYISLIDMLIESLRDSKAPFADEAEDLLEFTTGRSFVMGAHERFSAWWQSQRPVLTRGGGALLVAQRLMRMESYDDAAQMLTRFSADGLLSFETDVLRRGACFLSLFARPQWRMTSSDIPRYFNEGFYYLATEMGVLRFPTAELPEVVGCCRRRQILQDSKKRLIEDALEVWQTLGDDIGPQLALLLKRLLQHKGRQCPARLSYWREQWQERQGAFERPVSMLMDGIAATADKKYALAAEHFEEAARLEPYSSLPLVNLVHLRLSEKRTDSAKALIAEIVKRYPRDGQAMISLGRLLAMHLEDTHEAETLFIKALECSDTPVEALICLGEVKLLQGQYFESQQYFDHARQLDPALADPKLGLARVYMETKRYDRAIENLELVLGDGQIESTNLAHYLLYRTYREMGDDRAAFKHLDKVPAPFFKEPDVLDDIAVHLESGKQYIKAREFAERAMLLRAGGSSNDDPDALSAH